MAALQTTDLLVVQPSTGDTSTVNKTKVSTLLSLATAPTLQAVTAIGNTTKDGIEVLDDSNAVLAALAPTSGNITTKGTIAAEGTITAGVNPVEIKLDSTNGKLTCSTLDTSGNIVAANTTTAALSITLNPSTGQIGDSIATTVESQDGQTPATPGNFIDGGVYSA